MFSIPKGSRKITAFFVTLLLYTLLAGTALLVGAGKGLAFDSFVFQLAAGYSAISGLFFTGNVLEHYANSPVRSSKYSLPATHNNEHTH